MLIECKKCGARISESAIFCPRCKNINENCKKSKKNSVLAVLSLIWGIIAVVYSASFCVSNYLGAQNGIFVLVCILFTDFLALVFGIITSIKFNFFAKGVIGIVFGLLAIFISIIGYFYF